MEYHKSEIKAGVFISIAVAAMIVLIIKVGGLWETFTKHYQYYSTHFTDVQLLKEGAPVTMAGRRIGQVISVGKGVDDPKYRLLTKVVVKVMVDRDENGDKILVDDQSRLIVTKYGLLDEPNLSLKSGTGASYPGGESPAEAKPLPDGVTPGGMQELMDSGSALLDKLNKSWDATVDPTLKDLHEMIASLKNQVAEKVPENLLGKLHKLLDDADATIVDAQKLINENRPNLQKITGDLTKLTDDLDQKVDEILGNLNQVLGHADGILVENDRNIYETIHQLKETMYHMKQFARKVEADPSQLIFGSQPVEESRGVKDQTDWRLKGRTGPYTQETRADVKKDARK